MTEAQPFEMRVELGKAREFARATGSAHPDHLAAEGAVTTPTFLMSAAFWQAPESKVVAPGNPARMLHGAQEFEFPAGPPPVGAVLTGQSRLGKVWTKEGRRGGTMTFTEIVTEYRDTDGTVVAIATSTGIETSQAAGS